MSRHVWFLATAAFAIVVALSYVLLQRPTTTSASHSVLFGLVGDPNDPPAAAGGSTRDKSDPTAIVVSRGASVDFINRSGGMHQVSIYTAGLNYDTPECGIGSNAPCANLTTFADIQVLQGELPWGNFIAPPDGSAAVDNAATSQNESRAGAGLLAMGPSPVGLTGPQRQSGAIDFSYTFSEPGQYLVVCNFRPHFVSYGHATFVVVTP
jgi:plastocyanin